MDNGYEKLEIYKLSKKLAIRVHEMSLRLPKFEMYEEGSQIRRSSKSIPSNIVEGYCLRRHKNEFFQYLHGSFGSCEETTHHLKMLYETKSLIDKETYDFLIEKYDHLGRIIFRFIESVISDHLQPMYVKEDEPLYEA